MGIISALLCETDAIPMLLFVTPAANPQTKVPCPKSELVSCAVGSGLLSLSAVSQPFTSSIKPLLSSSIPLFGISAVLCQKLAAKSS